MNLEEMLAEITKYGRSSIFEHENGYWSCRITLRVVMPGGQYEIKSELNKHQTAKSAVSQSLEYLRQTFRNMRKELDRIEAT